MHVTSVDQSTVQSAAAVNLFPCSQLQLPSNVYLCTSRGTTYYLRTMVSEFKSNIHRSRTSTRTTKAYLSLQLSLPSLLSCITIDTVSSSMRRSRPASHNGACLFCDIPPLRLENDDGQRRTSISNRISRPNTMGRLVRNSLPFSLFCLGRRTHVAFFAVVFRRIRRHNALGM